MKEDWLSGVIILLVEVLIDSSASLRSLLSKGVAARIGWSIESNDVSKGKSIIKL